MGSAQAKTRMPVLRHRVGGDAGGGWRGGRARSRRGAARDARAGGRRRRGIAQRAAPGALPELQRDLAARSRAPGAKLRVLRVGAARRLRRGARDVPARGSAAVQRRRGQCARSHPRVVWPAVARTRSAQAARADRHRQGRLPAVLDFQRARRRDVDGGGRPLLLDDRDLFRRRAEPHAPGAPGAMGTRVRAPCAPVRQRPRVRVGGRAPGTDARHRAVSDERAEAL